MGADLGVVVQDEGGTRLQDITVTAGFLGGNNRVSRVTDRSGIALFDDVAPGSYLVTVNDPRFPSATAWVTVRNNASNLATVTLYPMRHIYFAIYYKVKDGAFQRAAETWAREVRGRKDFSARTDSVLLIEQLSEGDFKTAWNVVYQESQRPGRRVVEGRLFTHASYGSSNDGLEFKPDDSGGTLDRKEIASLPKLNWDYDGKLVLHGCNTAKGYLRGWTPARELANSQRVDVHGLDGFGYFSTKRDKYSEIDGSSTTVYLYAYDRRRNATGFGNGWKLPEIVYHPQ